MYWCMNKISFLGRVDKLFIVMRDKEALLKYLVENWCQRCWDSFRVRRIIFWIRRIQRWDGGICPYYSPIIVVLSLMIRRGKETTHICDKNKCKLVLGSRGHACYRHWVWRGGCRCVAGRTRTRSRGWNQSFDWECSNVEQLGCALAKPFALRIRESFRHHCTNALSSVGNAPPPCHLSNGRLLWDHLARPWVIRYPCRKPDSPIPDMTDSAFGEMSIRQFGRIIQKWTMRKLKTRLFVFCKLWEADQQLWAQDRQSTWKR